MPAIDPEAADSVLGGKSRCAPGALPPTHNPSRIAKAAVRCRVLSIGECKDCRAISNEPGTPICQCVNLSIRQ